HFGFWILDFGLNANPKSKIQNPKSKMLTLGIDPGTAIMGYGLVESGVSVSGEQDGSEELRLVEYGALRTPAHTPMVERLPMLYAGLVELLSEHKPGTVAIEE